MSALLQVALFLASIAFIVLVACFIPMAFQAKRHLEQMAITVGQLKTDVNVLVHDSREFVQNLNALATRANRQMDDVNQVFRTVRQWTERADRVVGEVGSAIEPPVFSLVRNVNLVRVGLTSFFKALWTRNRHKTKPDQTPKENDHV